MFELRRRDEHEPLVVEGDRGANLERAEELVEHGVEDTLRSKETADHRQLDGVVRRAQWNQLVRAFEGRSRRLVRRVHLKWKYDGGPDIGSTGLAGGSPWAPAAPRADRVPPDALGSHRPREVHC